MVSSQGSSTVCTFLFVSTVVLILIVTAESGNGQYTNRAVRRISKGCARWGQACLGGHFKKRAKEYPASSEQADAVDIMARMNPLLGNGEVGEASSDMDRLTQLQEMAKAMEASGALYPWNKYNSGGRPRPVDTGYRR